MSTDRDDEPPHRTRIGATTDSIALIASVNGRGVILAYDGPGIEDYIEAIGSRYLGDLGLDDAPDGLSIWEGHLSTYGEYDAEPCGSFRALTDAEWARLRETGTPWEYDELAACDPSPEPKFQPSTIDPHAWTVVDSYERADGSRTWRAMGPWRATRKEAERDAEHGSMLGALPELSAPSREGDQRMKTTVTTEEIVAAIRGGEHTFEGIRRRLGVRAIDFRALDRALQKARKAGLIRYERGRGWEVVERKRGAEAVTAPTPALSVETALRVIKGHLGSEPMIMCKSYFDAKTLYELAECFKTIADAIQKPATQPNSKGER